MTAQPHADVRFRRAIERRALWLVEEAAREFPNLPLEDALQLVHFYAERGSPKYEKATMRRLGFGEICNRRWSSVAAAPGRRPESR